MEGYQPSTFHYNSFAFLEFGSERSVLSFILNTLNTGTAERAYFSGLYPA